MGLNPFWQEDFFLTVQNFNHDALIFEAEPYFIVECQPYLLINLVPLNNNFTAEELLLLQEDHQKRSVQLVHLWEDVWLAKRTQVLSRIRSFLGLNTSIHGRKTKIEDLSKYQISNFLDQHHLQGFINAKYHYGLMLENELIAAASFSSTRPMKSRGPDYSSAELVRFATKDGFTVVGGLSKLIKHFTKQLKMNDLMTYADRDWSLGKGYNQLGFTLSKTTEPVNLYVHRETLIRYFQHRLPKDLMLAFETQKGLALDDFLVLNGYDKVFNTGNLKYHLYL